MIQRKLFVTTALPYANGALHIGHIMEYIQADIWVRFQRMLGHQVHFVGADDAHGAPIMIAAEKAGQSPREYVAGIAAARPRYLQGFGIGFDHWHSTESPENTELSQQIYLRLREHELIAIRPVEQFFDPVKGMFLPDRYVKGTCPSCGAPDQYGDACEVCGAVYAPTELKNPYSVLSGAKPQLKTSEHYFFRLSDPRCIDFLRQWTQSGHLQPEVANKAREWLEGERGLSDWDISRDAPYFGIPIPDAPGKYFYVWLDAPVGYLASLKAYCAQRGIDFEALLRDPATEQIHFIGKDIIYFHTLFWPAMLKFAGPPFKVPDRIYVHGFITVSGEKMSKSRGTGVDPLRYLELGLNPEWLRYYIAAKLNSHVEDIDFNAEDFVARVNSDLVGKYVNIASRASNFIHKNFAGALADVQAAPGQQLADPILDSFRACAAELAQLYEAREFGKAMREVMTLADAANQWFDARRPWELAKAASSEPQLHLVSSVAINLFRLAGAGARCGRLSERAAAAVEARGSRAARRAPHCAVPAPDGAGRPQAAGRPVRAARGGAARRAHRGRRRGARGGAGNRRSDDRHRRVRESRPAHRAHHGRRAGRRQRQAAEADAGPGRRPASAGLLRDQVGLSPGGPGGALDRGGGQFSAAQDEIRPERRHGAGRQRRVRRPAGPVPARRGPGGSPGHAGKVGKRWSTLKWLNTNPRSRVSCAK